MPQIGPIIWLVPIIIIIILLLFIKTSLAFPNESGTEVNTTNTNNISWNW